MGFFQNLATFFFSFVQLVWHQLTSPPSNTGTDAQNTVVSSSQAVAQAVDAAAQAAMAKKRAEQLRHQQELALKRKLFDQDIDQVSKQVPASAQSIGKPFHGKNNQGTGKITVYKPVGSTLGHYVDPDGQRIDQYIRNHPGIVDVVTQAAGSIDQAFKVLLADDITVPEPSVRTLWDKLKPQVRADGVYDGQETKEQEENWRAFSEALRLYKLRHGRPLTASGQLDFNKWSQMLHDMSDMNADLSEWGSDATDGVIQTAIRMEKLPITPVDEEEDVTSLQAEAEKFWSDRAFDKLKSRYPELKDKNGWGDLSPREALALLNRLRGQYKVMLQLHQIIGQAGEQWGFEQTLDKLLDAEGVLTWLNTSPNAKAILHDALHNQLYVLEGIEVHDVVDKYNLSSDEQYELLISVQLSLHRAMAMEKSNRRVEKAAQRLAYGTKPVPVRLRDEGDGYDDYDWESMLVIYSPSGNVRKLTGIVRELLRRYISASRDPGKVAMGQARQIGVGPSIGSLMVGLSEQYIFGGGDPGYPDSLNPLDPDIRGDSDLSSDTTIDGNSRSGRRKGVSSDDEPSLDDIRRGKYKEPATGEEKDFLYAKIADLPEELQPKDAADVVGKLASNQFSSEENQNSEVVVAVKGNKPNWIIEGFEHTTSIPEDPEVRADIKDADLYQKHPDISPPSTGDLTSAIYYDTKSVDIVINVGDKVFVDAIEKPSTGWNKYLQNRTDAKNFGDSAQKSQTRAINSILEDTSMSDAQKASSIYTTVSKQTDDLTYYMGGAAHKYYELKDGKLVETSSADVFRTIQQHFEDNPKEASKLVESYRETYSK